MTVIHSDRLVYTAKKTSRDAKILAAVVVIIHLIFALILPRGDSGMTFRFADQVGIFGIGLVLGAALLLCTRPRIIADNDGISIRNFLGDRHFVWSDVVAITYLEKSRWAQLELPHDEHIPVLAIQARDGLDAVNAMDQLYLHFQKYHG